MSSDRLVNLGKMAGKIKSKPSLGKKPKGLVRRKVVFQIRADRAREELPFTGGGVKTRGRLRKGLFMSKK